MYTHIKRGDIEPPLPADLQEEVDKFTLACQVLRAHSLMPCSFLGSTQDETRENIYRKAKELIHEDENKNPE